VTPSAPVDTLSGRGGLDGVRATLSGAPWKRALRAELQAMLTRDDVLGACRLRRAKFKPGRKLTGYYDVGLAPGDGWQPVRPVAVAWSASELRAAAPPSGADMRALEAAAAEHGLAAPFRRLSGAADGMQLLVWPLDPRCPDLVHVASPPAVRDLLPGAERSPVAVIRYRPGQRHVLRLGSDEAALFVKLAPGRDLARSAAVADGVGEWLSEAGTGVGVARPAAVLADGRAVAYRRLTGAPLTTHLRRPGPGLGRHLDRAGSVLRALHGAPASIAARLPGHALDAELVAVARAGEHLAPLLPSAATRLRSLLDRAGRLDARVATPPAVLVHGDYKADHLWVRAEGLGLLDFDTCRRAEPAVDLGKILADLRWWHAVSGQAGDTEARARVLGGYRIGALPAEYLWRARLWEAVLLAKMTVRRVRLFDRFWRSRTESLLGRAEAVLADLEADVLPLRRGA
jgi:aminoglycoside phosphotransferase (APT) family kinase protein